MNQEDQGKKSGPVISDAAVTEVIPAKPTGELSEQDLAAVAGGTFFDIFTEVSTDGGIRRIGSVTLIR